MVSFGGEYPAGLYSRGLNPLGAAEGNRMSRQEKISRKRIAKEPFREHLVMVVTTVLVGIVVLAVVNHFIEPAPPRNIVMSTGMEGGSYAAYAEWYRQILGREKVRLELLSSSGSVENLKRLQDPSFKVDVGFVQGGTGSRSEAPNLLSLGALFYTPLWVFYRSPETYDDLSRLKGKKINIGPEGSGVRKFAIDLLEASKAADPPTSLLDLTNTAAAKELVEGKIDAVMIFGTADSPIVQELLHKEGVKLLSFSQAEAYTRLFPALSHVILPAGLLDLAKKKPPADVHLLATTTNLVARDTLHPALVYLLLDAAAEIHSGGGWVHKAGEFPSPKAQDFPLSDRAERFYKSGRPLLVRLSALLGGDLRGPVGPAPDSDGGRFNPSHPNHALVLFLAEPAEILLLVRGAQEPGTGSAGESAAGTGRGLPDEAGPDRGRGERSSRSARFFPRSLQPEAAY